MYIKFCRSYEGDRKDGAKPSSDSKLCVELEGDRGTSELFFILGQGLWSAVFAHCAHLSHRQTDSRRKHPSVQACVWNPHSNLRDPAAGHRCTVCEM